MQRALIPFAALVSLAVLLLAGQTSRAVHAAGDQPAKVAVSIDNFNFAPNAITVAVGTTVVWTNNDDVPHNVTNPDKAFKSPTLDTGEKWEYTFQKAGTFNYYCTIHPKMTGKVVVQ
jgi:plastocyanin